MNTDQYVNLSRYSDGNLNTSRRLDRSKIGIIVRLFRP